MFYHNQEWDSMPWNHFNDPMERFMVLPSFVIGEFYFIFLALACLCHAICQGRTHVMVWIAALTTGTANDAIFMFLPFVDNFWQAQACIMLTPRMPLYIPCVYIVFMYSSTVACWRLGLPLLASVSLTGIYRKSLLYSIKQYFHKGWWVRWSMPLMIWQVSSISGGHGMTPMLQFIIDYLEFPLAPQFGL